jgi:hypothetical protein
MKKAILAMFTVVGMMSATVAQNIVIESYDAVVGVNSTAVNDYYGHLDVKNASGSSLNIKSKRMIYGATQCAFDSAYFCWDLCYGSDVNASVGAVTVAAGETNTLFSGHVYSGNTGVSCVDSIRYTFFDAANPNDSVSVVVKYEASAVFSVTEKELPVAKLYPNPAVNFVVVELTTPATQGTTIELFNLLGAKVRTVKASGTRIEIPVGDLHNGIYLCTINKNGKALETRKINVRH